jgi:putative iron-dependent peroxidase
VSRNGCGKSVRKWFAYNMYTPQAGIFALGTSSHAYLEFDLLDAKKYQAFATALASIREPRTTTGGVNFVIGFRPEIWNKIATDDAPAGVEGFNREIRGTEGFVMPATQHDGLVWLSGSAYEIVFDMARSVVRALAGQASLQQETSSWSYQHDRDLTGFVDGSENPTLLDAPGAALLPEGVPGAAGSILLLQKWKHLVAEWEALPVDRQERIMGRTKPDSIELENKPSDSHVARTDQDQFGHIFRRNMPYGSVDDHGTVFVGFSAEQKRLSGMLESMAGLLNGQRDALTRLNAAPEPYSMIPTRAPSGHSVIEIADLGFRYGPQLPMLFRNFNLRLAPGRITALMGPSGSGKSTLAKLLLGMYRPSEGQVRIDGRDIAYLSANELRAHFGVVPQETILFSGTIFSNLIAVDSRVTFEQVIRACQVAEIHETIERLPNGYQTEIGERGVGLSGGQKQRVAIARALIKNPKVLIFDEATSSLDAPTAEHFCATVNQLKGKVTMLFITHSLPRNLQVDEIVQIGVVHAAPTGAGSLPALDVVGQPQ